MATEKTRKNKIAQESGLVRVQLVHSLIGVPEKIRRVATALGLRKMNSIVVKENNPAIQGMIFKVKHLVKVERVAK
jgi:large subunit ribosomal protein L30